MTLDSEFDQWPIPDQKTLDKLKVNSSDSKNIERFTRDIENYLSKKFGYKCILFPSGRSALHHLMIANGANRSSEVFIPRYCSFCLYQSFGSLLNVSSTFGCPDYVLVNHKWGNINLDSRVQKSHYVIEDFCDSLINERTLLFPNNGQVALISLSKTFRALLGGILLFREESEVLERLFRMQNSDSDFGNSQASQKLRALRDRNVEAKRTYYAYEYENNSIPMWALENIVDSLELLDERFKFYQERISAVASLFGRVKNGAIQAPGIPVKLSQTLGGGIFNDLKSVEKVQRIPRRKFDISLSNDAAAEYVDVMYIPTHDAIDSAQFQEIIDFLNLNKTNLQLAV